MSIPTWSSPSSISKPSSAPALARGCSPNSATRMTAARTRISSSTSRPTATPKFWSRVDFGIRCVISTSFGDIFYNNCFKNGILPIRVTQDDLDKLFDDAERGANATLTIDLAAQEIRGPDGGTVKFEIDAFRKHCLLNGLDDIGLTMAKKDKISGFETRQKDS